MSTTNYINRIPTQVDEFQNYINTTDDTQKAIDPNGFTIYPLGADGKYNYSATENTKEIKNEPMYIRWNWTAPESSQWSAFRKEYNVLYQKCNPESNAIDIELKKQLDEVISRFIQFDKQNLLIQRVSDSHPTVLSHFQLFNIKRDILQLETDLRTISVNYEKQEPLTTFENPF